MRKVKIAAIQPANLGIPGRYNCLSEGYVNNPEEITENYVKKNLEVTFRLLEKAGADGCDIVTTCEDIAGLNHYIVDITEKNIFPELVRMSRPLVEEKLSGLSARYSMYIVGCYFKFIGDKIYNTATIFDRKGKIVGEYCKVQLPPDETWQVAEGNSLDVFELDFGKIGILICYDMMFPECARVLSLKGAEIIFHPTFGYGWYDAIGEATLKTRANDNSVYIATAKNYIFNHAGKSSIVDYWGHVLVEAGFYKDVVVSKEIDLDVKKVQPEWYNPTHMSGTAEMRRRHLMERRPELYTEICVPREEKFVVPGKDKQLSIIEKIKTGKCHW